MSVIKNHITKGSFVKTKPFCDVIFVREIYRSVEEGFYRKKIFPFPEFHYLSKILGQFSF